MSIMPQQERDFRFIDMAELLKTRTKAYCSDVWLQALPRIGQGLSNLTETIGCNVHSYILAQTRRLQRSLLSNGATGKHKWARDMSFMRYPAIMKLSSHPLTVSVE